MQDEDSVEIVEVRFAPQKSNLKSNTIKAKPQIKSCYQSSEDLLRFHNYIMKETRSPIYDNEEIYKNHPIRFLRN